MKKMSNNNTNKINKNRNRNKNEKKNEKKSPLLQFTVSNKIPSPFVYVFHATFTQMQFFDSVMALEKRSEIVEDTNDVDVDVDIDI